MVGGDDRGRIVIMFLRVHEERGVAAALHAKQRTSDRRVAEGRPGGAQPFEGGVGEWREKDPRRRGIAVEGEA